MKFALDAMPKDPRREQYCYNIVRCLRYTFHGVCFCSLGIPFRTAGDLLRFCKSSVRHLRCQNLSFYHRFSNVIRYLDLRQEGTDEDDFMLAAVQTDDGNVVVAGYTRGSWNDTNYGWLAVAAAKLKAEDGDVMWRYQVG